jgi:hypothetical protein
LLDCRSRRRDPARASHPAAAGLSLDLAGVLEFRRARTTINPLRPES